MMFKKGNIILDQTDCKAPHGWQPILAQPAVSGQKQLGFPINKLNLNKKRFLFERLCGGLGDLIMTLSAVQALKKLNPEAEIWYRTKPEYVPLLKLSRDIDYVITLAEQSPLESEHINLWKPCPAAVYEARANPKINLSRHEIFTLASGLPWLGLKPELFSGSLGLDELSLKPRPFIGIEEQAGEVWRTYPHWKKVAKKLKRTGATIIWFGRHPPRFADLAISRADLAYVASVVSNLDLLLSQDSGLAHLAGALDVPSLLVFGPTDPRCRIDLYQADVIQSECSRMPCWYYGCNGKQAVQPCLERILPKRIIQTVLMRYL